jgi:hypothetical protein
MLASHGIVWTNPGEKIQINRTVSGENWNLTVMSVQNTEKQEWREAALTSRYRKIKDENICFWKFEIKIIYLGFPASADNRVFEVNTLRLSFHGLLSVIICSKGRFKDECI